MTTEDFKRKLTAILSADVVGYSRLMGEDEEGTVRTLSKYRKIIFGIIERNNGRLVDSPGDNILAEFVSLVDAVRCGVQIQEDLKENNEELPPDRKMEFRIGINIGDVIQDSDRIYGDGVNVAARIESLADPGGICISRTAYDQVKKKLRVDYEYLGEYEVKNIDEPVRVYKIMLESRDEVVQDRTKNKLNKKTFNTSLAVIIIIIIGLGLFIFWNRYINPIRPSEVSPLKKETAPAKKSSIAVLPFVNMSDDPKNEYFSDGMAEEIINGLSKLSGLIVKARTSSFKFKGKNEDVRKIGEILNVTHVLEGSVRKSGNHIRVTAQLIATKEDAHIWSGQYDRELTDVFAIQDDITGAILKELNIHLLSSHKKQKPTNNMEAYEAYLMGRQRLLKDTITSQAEAIKYFQKAVDLDNDFALAYVGLADSFMYHMIYSGLSRNEWLIRAENAIERALKIDDQLGEAYNSLGVFRLLQSNDMGTATDNKEAEMAFKRALEFNPNYFDTYYNYGDYLMISNRFEEALAWHKKGIELDPLNTGIITSSAGELIGLGRFDEALKQYDRVIEIDPSYPSVYSDKGSLYSSLGKLYEAARMFRKSISLEPNTPYHEMSLGNVYANLGDLKQAGYWSKQSIKMNPDSLYSNLGMFEYSVLLGEEESAKKYGRKILELDRKKYVIGYVLNYFKDLDLNDGQYNEARKWFADAYPELLDTKTVNIGLINYEAAISFAHALINTGEQKHANLLLNKSLEYIKALPRLGKFGYGIADARIYMLQGKKKEALDRLRKAVDSGWREDWKYYLEHESILEPLHNEPEFKDIVQVIKDDMAAQLASVRELEKNDPDWQ